MILSRRIAAAAAAAVAAAGAALLLAAPAAAANGTCAWRPAWAAAQMIPEGENELPRGAMAQATLRQIVRASIGGTALRVRISNAFGTAPLLVASASVALSPDNRAAAVVALHALSFGGARAITIPAGAEWLSDPVDLPVTAFQDIAISLHLAADPAVRTGHPGARATSWLAPGDQVDAAVLSDARPIDRWFQLAAIEVRRCAAPSPPVVVVMGDSITDGRGSTTNGNDRWTDILAHRLGGRAAVLNAGLGGNRLLLDGLGPNVLARLDRDVLAVPGISHLILLAGINDLGMLTRESPASPAEHRALVERMTGAYAQIVARAHGRGIKVIGATLLPFMGFDYYHPDAANEADRQAINAWLRAPGHVDALVDFDAIMRDPAHAERLRPDFDSGDHLHPSPAGYRAMGDAVPLALLRH